MQENGEYVGPFKRLRDANQFLELMKLFGANCEGIKIVALDVEIGEDGSAVTRQEKHRLTAVKKGTKTPPVRLENGTDVEGEPGGQRARPQIRRTTLDRKRQ